MQPWQTYVASGSLRDRLRAQMMERVQSKVPPSQDHKEPKRNIGQVYKDRRRECAAVLYRAMDIEWDDKPARASASFRNFELFDAPHVAFLCMDEGFGLGSAWDVGMYAQTLMLMQHEGSFHLDDIRRLKDDEALCKVLELGVLPSAATNQ